MSVHGICNLGFNRVNCQRPKIQVNKTKQVNPHSLRSIVEVPRGSTNIGERPKMP